MKIGAFAQHNQVSIDTVRHYMDLSLIIPKKEGSHYCFNTQCQSDFEQVTFLKQLGFTLIEIQMLIQFKRFGQCTDYGKRSSYKTFFKKKKETLSNEIKRLTFQLESLELYRMKMDEENETTQVSMGVPYEALSLLSCTNCQGTYKLTEGQIVNDQLDSGKLVCPCGSTLTIESGILFGEGIQLCSDVPTHNEGFIDEYIQTTDTEYLKKLYQGMEWTKSNVSFKNVERCVALELGSGHGFFLRQAMHTFPKHSLYIAVDYDPTLLKWLKNAISRDKPAFNILFLCANFKTLPLKRQSVDILLDISGSSNYAFEETTFLVEQIKDLLKTHCDLLGYYIVFEKFVKDSKVKLPYRALFSKAIIQERIKNQGFEEINSFITETIERGGPLESYFVEGEKVGTYIFYGTK